MEAGTFGALRNSRSLAVGTSFRIVASPVILGLLLGHDWTVTAILFQLIGGVRASMGYCGCRTIAEMNDKAEFVQITGAGLRESHVHDVQITKEAPNYHVD